MKPLLTHALPLLSRKMLPKLNLCFIKMINPSAPPPTDCREEGRLRRPRHLRDLQLHFSPPTSACSCPVWVTSSLLDCLLFCEVSSKRTVCFGGWFLLASACHSALELSSYVTGQMWSLINIRLFLFSFLLLARECVQVWKRAAGLSLSLE